MVDCQMAMTVSDYLGDLRYHVYHVSRRRLDQLKSEAESLGVSLDELLFARLWKVEKSSITPTPLSLDGA
jgi:hypothetical protein